MKSITVFLTNDDLYGFIDSQEDMPKIAYTWEAFQAELALESEQIYTTLLDAVDSSYYEKGYDIIVISEGKYIKFSDLLRTGFEGREIRTTHNWQRMLKNNTFAPAIRANWSFYIPVPGVIIKR
jgi:hypothetical protein